MPDLEAVAGALVLRPGDTLIVGFSTEYLTREDAADLTADIRAKLPQLAGVVIMTQVSVLAAYRPEAVDA